MNRPPIVNELIEYVQNGDTEGLARVLEESTGKGGITIPQLVLTAGYIHGDPRVVGKGIREVAKADPSDSAKTDFLVSILMKEANKARMVKEAGGDIQVDPIDTVGPIETSQEPEPELEPKPKQRRRNKKKKVIEEGIPAPQPADVERKSARVSEAVNESSQLEQLIEGQQMLVKMVADLIILMEQHASIVPMIEDIQVLQQKQAEAGAREQSVLEEMIGMQERMLSNLASGLYRMGMLETDNLVKTQVD